MPPSDYPPEIAGPVKRLQIIVVVALVAAGAFLGYALLQRANVAPPTDRPNWFFSWTAAAFGVAIILLVVQGIVPAMMVEAGRRKLAMQQARGAAPAGGETAALMGLYQQRVLVSVALLTVAAFVVIGAYLYEGTFKDYIGWGGALLLMGVTAYHFPILPNVARWVEEQRKLLAQDRKAAAGAA